jgi:hypothetical protein
MRNGPLESTASSRVEWFRRSAAAWMSGSGFFATTLALIGLARYPWIPARQLGHSQVGDDETEGLLLEGRERCQAIHGFDDRAGELAHEHPPQHRSRRRFVVNDQDVHAARTSRSAGWIGRNSPPCEPVSGRQDPMASGGIRDGTDTTSRSHSPHVKHSDNSEIPSIRWFDLQSDMRKSSANVCRARSRDALTSL